MTDQPDPAARILAAVEVALGDQLTTTARAQALDHIRSILTEQAATAEAELAKLRAVSRGYCPHCGRGDCAPRLEDWERERQRAEHAEAERDELREEYQRQSAANAAYRLQIDELIRRNSEYADRAITNGQRAEHAEAERDELRTEITATVARLADMAKSRAEQDGAELVRLRERAEQAEAAIARVRALHRPVEGLGYGPDDDDTPGAYGDIAQVCSSCGTSGEHGVRWPCPTIAALNPPKETQP